MVKNEDEKVHDLMNNQDEGAKDNKDQGKGNNEGDKEDKSAKALHGLIDKGKEDWGKEDYKYKENTREWPCKILHEEGLTHKHTAITHRQGDMRCDKSKDETRATMKKTRARVSAS